MNYQKQTSKPDIVKTEEVKETVPASKPAGEGKSERKTRIGDDSVRTCRAECERGGPGWTIYQCRGVELS
nr:putative Biomphalaria glabrata retrograde protein of 51 kDa; transcript variant X1 [Biomphalaria glabrata]